jgi:hypothetical protein
MCDVTNDVKEDVTYGVMGYFTIVIGMCKMSLQGTIKGERNIDGFGGTAAKTGVFFFSECS